MAGVLSNDCLKAIIDELAGRKWPAAYISILDSSDGNGVVSGAAAHFQALRELSRLELGEMPLPLRFCMPSEFDE